MSLFPDRRSGEDFSAEVDAHLELETDRLVDGGMSRDDAQAAARRAFGNILRARERFHEASRWTWLEQLVLDVRYAGRVLRQNPIFLVTTVLTLAVGLAVVTVAFTVFNAYVLKPYAVRSPETLHRIGWFSQSSEGATFRWRDYEAIRERRDLFDDVVAQDTQLLTSNGRPLVAALVSDNYFSSLAPRMLIGRGLAPFDATGTSAPVVIADHTWVSLFAGDATIVGREIDLSGRTFTIVGVLAPEFAGLGDTLSDVWVPLTIYADLLKPELTAAVQPRSVELLGWLREGVNIGQAQTSLTTMLAGTIVNQDNVRASVRPEPTPIPLDVELLLIAAPILATFGLVLVTASANLSNVMLARAIARHREIAVRLSIGASRGRVVRQLLTEGLLISLLAGVVGLALTAWVTRAGSVMFLSTLPPSFSDIIRLAPMGIDGRVFTFALLVSAASAALFALIPAVQGSRLSLTTALRGREAGSLKSSRFRSGLIVGQVSVSLLLVVTALTFTRSGLSLGSVDLGYEIGGVVSVTPRAEARALLPQMVSVLAADPRVTALAVTGGNPLKGRAQHRRVAAAPDDGNVAAVTWYTFASPEYFTLLRLPIERGRSFTADEAKGAARIAIISAATAAALWPGRDPIGQAMRLESLSAPDLTRSAEGDPARPDVILSRYSTVTVVGVTRAVVSGFLTDGVDPGHIYLPVSSQHPLATALLLRGRTDYDLSPAVMQELFSRVGADPQAFETIPVQELRDVQLYPLRAASLIGTLLGAITLALSVSGLYGVLTYSVNQRRREIGIRMALGATAGIVVRLVMRQMVRLAVFGTAIGLVLAFTALRTLNSATAFATASMLDVTAFMVGLSMVLAATAIASFYPARRATRVDPATTLRADA